MAEFLSNNPIRKVCEASGYIYAHGVNIYPPTRFEYEIDDVSDSQAGRTEDGLMHKNKVAQKVKLTLSWQNVTGTVGKYLLEIFDPEYLKVQYLDLKTNSFLTKIFYVGNRTAKEYSAAVQQTTGYRWSSIAFNLIEVKDTDEVIKAYSDECLVLGQDAFGAVLIRVFAYPSGDVTLGEYTESSLNDSPYSQSNVGVSVGSDTDTTVTIDPVALSTEGITTGNDTLGIDTDSKYSEIEGYAVGSDADTIVTIDPVALSTEGVAIGNNTLSIDTDNKYSEIEGYAVGGNNQAGATDNESNECFNGTSVGNNTKFYSPTTPLKEYEKSVAAYGSNNNSAIINGTIIHKAANKGVALGENTSHKILLNLYGGVPSGKAIGNLSFAEVSSEIVPCLRFVSTDEFSITTASGLRNWDGELYWSTDRFNWYNWTYDTTTATLTDAIYSSGGVLYVRGEGNTEFCHYDDYTLSAWTFTHIDTTSTATVSISGQLESLMDWESVRDEIYPDVTARNAFAYMFSNWTLLTSAPTFGSMSVGVNAYSHMFYGCTQLETTPHLPATSLDAGCYTSMFEGCTSLTTAYDLPATTLAYGSYSSMFKDCVNLTTPPRILATTINSFSCGYMFENCTKLESIPKLYSLALGIGCYLDMFQNCTSIFLSTTETLQCPYEYRIPVEGTGTDSSWSCHNMFSNTSGTFTGTPTVNTTYYSNLPTI